MRRTKYDQSDPASDSDTSPSSDDSPPPRWRGKAKNGYAKNGNARKKRDSSKGRGTGRFRDDSDDDGDKLYDTRRGRALDDGPDSDFGSPSSSVLSSCEISFSQTTKLNTARNGRTLNGGRLLNGNKNNRKPREDSPRKNLKDKRLVNDDYDSRGKKAKKKPPDDTEDDSTPPIKPRGRKKKKNGGKVASDTEDSDTKGKDKPSYPQLVVQVGGPDSSNDCDTPRVTSSAALVHGNKPLAEIHLKGKANRTIRVRRNLLSGQFSDENSAMDRCCRCGAGCDMVGEITGTLPACQYCLEELGISATESIRPRTLQVLSGASSDQNELLEPMYTRGAYDPEVNEFGPLIICDDAADQEPSCDFDVLPEGGYEPVFPHRNVMRRSASFYSRPRALQEESPELPELVVRARVRKRPSRNKGFRIKSPETLEPPPQSRRSRSYAKYRVSLDGTDSQTQELGDMRDHAWEPDYGSPRSQRMRSARPRASPNRGGGGYQDRRDQARRFRRGRDDLPPEEPSVDRTNPQQEFSDDTMLDRSRAEESFGIAVSTTEAVDESETEKIAREAWKRYARDYKRFQQNLAAWESHREISQRRRCEDSNGEGMPRRPLAPPRPNCSMPDNLEEAHSRSGSLEERKANNDDEGMRIRIAVSPNRRSKLLLNETAAWFPGPFPPLGAEGCPPLPLQANQPLPIGTALPNSRPTHLVAPGEQQLIYIMGKPPGAGQPASTAQPAAPGIMSPTAVMSPVMSPGSANGSPSPNGNGSPVAKVPPSGPPPPS
ncbi:hypothetical protein HPB49_022105 [Dermacentor silvarum]|uniref:Uncharacterized protein n=1 Tax=Dermacentor silvarum TaxID=543639 RepID=A0ACB8DKT2_DERSI|nr:hypothetical protein HPB49_022105 [Dermacentor silvarum]